MKKLAMSISIFLMLILFSFIFYYVWTYNSKYNKIQSSELTSKEMRDEIIRQLKEKEGKTIRDYYIEDYFRKFKKE